MSKISAIINTLNEEKNIERAIKSLKNFSDEIIVCDMESEDKTVEIAKKLGAKVVTHKKMGYVEPARNFAIEKAQNDWIFILDADEEITEELAKRLKDISEKEEFDFVSIPRKNIIFDKWIENARWWPDYNIRFFRKGKVNWKDEIHSVPETTGTKLEIEPEEELAIIHYNYQSIDQFLERSIRYSKIQSNELIKKGYEYKWQDLITKPTSEFLSRYFSGEGYKDGLHGLVLSFMQAISEFFVYVRLWENHKFEEKNPEEILKIIDEKRDEFDFWLLKINPKPLKILLRKMGLK